MLGQSISTLTTPEYVLEGNKMKQFLTTFLLDETGLELSEYAVAAALVAIGAVGAFSALGGAVGARLNELASRVSG